MDEMLKAAMPGNYLVDLFPSLNLLPAWMAKFKRIGMEKHLEFTEMFLELLHKHHSGEVELL